MLNFPNAPTVGQGFISGPAWTWDGVKWAAVGAPAITTVVGSGTLPTGTHGAVLVNNSTGTSVVITLPTGPSLGQTIMIKDALGNASVHPIVVSSSATIDSNPTYTLRSDYASVEVFWMGSQWGTG